MGFQEVGDSRVCSKTERFYLNICNLLQVNQDQIIHVGDHFEFDYTVPQETGITSFYLDRKKEKKGENVVRDLAEFAEKMKVIK